MSDLESVVELDLKVAPALPARREFREQIARLEMKLSRSLVQLEPSRRPGPTSAPVTSAPRLLTSAELESTRDSLVARIGEIEGLLARQADDRTTAHELLKRMSEAPSEHRWATVTTKDLGDTSCRTWQSVPVLGPIGMLNNWWRIRMSSGCP